ncbi:hypothetical protein fugu_013787 [Takifugu bimaculatus]|uniref:Uncharacterized protein n=1 Tax=Takifugu bimaculatus TaxID=433685 RepID=A0A4Z2C486_9TELE|nr:hypothetical protein fugu_013787 [Takifugu bimaculatus]
MHICLLLLLKGQRLPFPPLDPLDPEHWQSSDLELWLILCPVIIEQHLGRRPCPAHQGAALDLLETDAPVVGREQRRGNAVCRNQNWNRGRRMFIAQRAQSQIECKKRREG